MVDAKVSKFIVQRENWPGENTYHYCGDCNEVVGIEKADEPLCPTCQAGPLYDIFTIIDAKLRTMWEFVEAMRVKDGPYGRYKCYRDDPWPYRLVASDQVMSLGRAARWCGYDVPWTAAQFEQWMDTILLDANPENGLIEDPSLIKEKGRTDEVLWEHYNWSRNLGSLFAHYGFANRYKLPQTVRQTLDVLKDKETAFDFLTDKITPLPFLEGRTWETDPYTKGSHVVRSIQNHEAKLSETGQADDGVVEFVHQWLEDKQNPGSGYWGGEKSSMNNASCGAFKVLMAYREHGWEVNHMERMVDTTLSIATPEGDFGDNGFGCLVFDPLLIFKQARETIPNYRRDDVEEVTARCFLNFLTHWSDEEHFFTPEAMQSRADLVGIHGLATPMFMAELLLGVKLFP